MSKLFRFLILTKRMQDYNKNVFLEIFFILEYLVYPITHYNTPKHIRKSTFTLNKELRSLDTADPATLTFSPILSFIRACVSEKERAEMAPNLIKSRRGRGEKENTAPFLGDLHKQLSLPPSQSCALHSPLPALTSLRVYCRRRVAPRGRLWGIMCNSAEERRRRRGDPRGIPRRESRRKITPEWEEACACFVLGQFIVVREGGVTKAGIVVGSRVLRRSMLRWG